jgi:PAS domain S-box-containing protein
VISTGKTLVTEEFTGIGEREFFTETRKIPILEKGKVARVVTVIRDITEHKQAEAALRESMEMYQTLVKLLPDSMVVLDLEGNILDLSQRALELHGYERREELLGKSGFLLVAPEETERLTKIAMKVLKSGFAKDLKYVLLKKDGSRSMGVMSFSLLKDAQGRPKGLIGIARRK